MPIGDYGNPQLPEMQRVPPTYWNGVCQNCGCHRPSPTYNITVTNTSPTMTVDAVKRALVQLERFPS